MSATEQQAAPDLTQMSAMRLALMARDARQQFGALGRAEPIAIVGMACRVPGADSPAELWQLLRDGVDAVGRVPADRWDVEQWYDPDPAAPGKSSITDGGFVSGIDMFDADFFGIIAREAERMDPQQRLFLEIAIEALDDAGLPRERLAGAAAGVFVASYYNDWAMRSLADPESIDGRTLTGGLHSVLANRLSHLLDLRGPSVSIDTACSSSLVAVHLACQSLRTGESDVALAGGVSLMLSPEVMVSLSKVGFISPSGRCRTFDAAADGFARGEGCGVVVLKRLADAVADGDRVLAVIRGTAVNQDGRSTVLSAPNGLAQRDLVRAALANAQMTPDRVGFVETHGTGTPLGDPIEVEALADTIGAPRTDGSVCYLGSVKANLGHLEAAAGVTGLIKATLALRHAEIPAQANYTTPNPHLRLGGTALAIADVHRSWAPGRLPRVAGVSGFGVGGTNAHVIVEEAPVTGRGDPEADTGEAELLVISARSADALDELATSWADLLDRGDVSLRTLAATAATRRSHDDHRLAVVGRSRSELAEALRRHATGAGAPDVELGIRPRRGAARVGFVFSGQGSQWPRMGVDLLAADRAFADALRAVDERFRAIGGLSVVDAISAPDAVSRLADTEVAQPAIFAVQVALAAMWRSWGVHPHAVVGHSVGELAALHVAGVLDLDEAARIVWHRGRIMQRATGLGAMTAVRCDVTTMEEILRDAGSSVSIAAVNAPGDLVVAGAPDAIDGFEAMLAERALSFRRLPVTYAFHSPQMESLARELTDVLGAVQARPASIEVFSTVTGARIDHRAIDAAYLGRNVRDTVRFADAVVAMSARTIDAVVELAPHAVLAPAITATLSGVQPDLEVAVSMRRERDGRETMLRAAAALYAAGATLAWEDVTGRPASPADLPAYPWQRRRHWFVGTSPTRSNPTWMRDHVIGGRAIMPATAMVELMREAASARLGHVSLADLAIDRPLGLDGAPSRRPTVTTDPSGASTVVLEGEDGEPVASATAIAPPRPAGHWTPVALTGGWSDDRAELDVRNATLGAHFGESFRTLRRWRIGDGCAEGVLAPTTTEAMSSGGTIHPAVLDGALQLCTLAGTSADGRDPGALMLPIAVDAITWSSDADVSPRAELRAEVRIDRFVPGGSLVASARVSCDGVAVVALDGIRFAPATSGALAGVDSVEYEVRWQDAPAQLRAADATGSWLIVADGVWSTAIAAALEAVGATCRIVDAAGVAEVIAAGGTAWRGVVHAVALDAHGDADDVRLTTSVLAVLRALEGSDPAPRLTLLTRGAQPALHTVIRPAGAALWGLANVIAAEHPELRCRAIDLDELATPFDADAIVAELLVEDEVAASVALRGARRLAPQLDRRRRGRRSDSPPLPLHARLSPGDGGTIDALTWRAIEAALPSQGEVRIRPHAVGVNFRDVLVTLGMHTEEDAPLGGECAGIVDAVGPGVTDLSVGDAVFGFVPGAMATEVVVRADFVRRVPAGLAVEQAASMPVAFLTAMLGLEQIAQVGPGDRVLVHAAAGGVGMAALQIARRRGAEVFATAGSVSKRAYVRALGVEHVFDSRDPSFADEVLSATGGAGVTVVLNSLSGPMLEAGLRCLAAGGWFLELGKREIWSAEQVHAVRPDVRYRVYDLGDALVAGEADAIEMLDALTDGLADGSLRPLPIQSADASRVGDVFRRMAQARHLGKLVVRLAHATPNDPRSRDRLVRPDATYWITGGLGALGVRTARWLADAGARHLVLTGRNEPGGEASAAVDELRARGVEVVTAAVDAGDRIAMEEIRDRIAATMPRLCGVVHSAGIADDGLLAAQTDDRVLAVMRGKAAGAQILDEITRGDDLDFFVLYSSMGWLLGPLGQGAYAAANAELDAIAWRRRGAGLPALSVAWGQWSGSGMGARLAEASGDLWSERGLGWIDDATGFRALEHLLREGAVAASVVRADWRTLVERLPSGVDRQFFAPVLPRAAPAGERIAATQSARRSSIVDGWRVAPPASRRRLVLAHLEAEARHVLGCGDDVVLDPALPLKDAGLDSLMAVELRNVLTRSLATAWPATLLFDHPSLGALATFVLDRLGLNADDDVASESAAAVTDATPPDDLDDIAALSEEEAEALLLAELEGGVA